MSGIPTIHKIVAPVDFSENAPLIIESATDLAAVLGAELHFIFVVQNFVDYSGLMEPQMPMFNFDEELLNSAKERMKLMIEEKRDFFSVAGVKTVIHTVLAGDVSEEIMDYAALVQANLIVMGTHGYKGLDKLLFGSVATKVVQAAPCPVLTINPYTCCTGTAQPKK